MPIPMGSDTARQTPRIKDVETRIGPIPPRRPAFSGGAVRNVQETWLSPCQTMSPNSQQNTAVTSPAVPQTRIKASHSLGFCGRLIVLEVISKPLLLCKIRAMLSLGERRNHGVAPPHRCPMGPDSSPSARCPPAANGRTTDRRCSTVLRRDPVDPLDWRPVERTAPTIWQSEHVLETAAAVGSQWGAPGVVAGVPGPAQCPPETPLE